ncbi:MAG: sensor histidine kinase, partial [Bacteroidetes bacterium]|nr:sensor histidine kinase [Bacteroidota bacterium]
ITDRQGIASTWNSIGKANLENGMCREALKSLQKSLDIARELGLKDIEKEDYSDMAAAYAHLEDFTSAFHYKELYSALNDSLFNEESQKQLADMQIKYDTEKKEKEIELLNKEKQLEQNNKKNLIYAISIGFLLIVIIAMVSFNSYRHRQRHKQLLIQQEADKALREAEKRTLGKIIEAEEKERNRFAKDLHDGIGPLLSSIKLYVNELTTEDTEEAEKQEMLNYTNELLDDAVKSTRTIANNLMPSVINDYGLVKALQSFCDKISLTRSVTIRFTSNTEERFEKTAEIILYRIVMELINNTIRHAEAKQISIALNKAGNDLRISYSDDGKGFNVEKTLNDRKTGLGLNNIITRIRSVDGSCEMKSEPGKGTEVAIRLNLAFFHG